ncbi:phage major capsid protein [Marinobacterium stanieri]|uniref:Phage major capsid protein, HK97 family n=1 Tax=Marinobacterium stanieri TaxID=49186 RepID=A0A1N6QBU1_9GAMM|nr:phage major capsid protein [Marinobacterium stanieri]SIQ13896.1 phage major capsid protein, HK97 family [Marinobacterium stanieri]
MAVELKDIEQVAEEFGQKFEEFKSKNDKRIDALESEKGKLSETVETLNGKLTDLDKYKKELEEELAALSRPGATGTDAKAKAEHKAAFDRFMRKGHDDGLRELEQKALSTDSDPDGGYIVTEEVDTSIERVMGDMGVMRQLATVRPVGSATYKKLTNQGGATSGWVGEREERSETGTPSLSELAFPTMELYAEPKATQSMLEDGMFDIESWLADEVGTEFSEKEAGAFITGNGVNKPRGILGYEAVANSNYAWGKLGYIASGGAGAFASSNPSDKLITLVHSLKRGYRQGASFLMNDMSLMQVRLLKDADGNYLWRPGLEAGAPSTLLGYTSETDDFMPDIAANSLSIAFGDFKRGYVITDRRGVQVLRDPFTAKPYVKFYTTKRVGGGVQNFEAIKLMKFATS